MTTTNVFLSKHKAATLPLKYVRLSVSSIFHKDIRSTDIDELDAIQDQFAKFIETPLFKPTK
jgi:hypothetical protein